LVRVLIVASEAPPVVSGVARSVGEIAEGLSARGHYVQVVTSAAAPGLRWDRLRLSTVGLRLRSIAVDSTPFDIVNIHGPAPTISDVSLVRSLTGRNSPPVVYTHHFSLHFGVTGADTLGRAYEAAIRRIVSRCAAVVTTTPASARQFARLGDRVSVVPWGVDQCVAPGVAREYDGTRPLRVLAVGQFRRYKGMAIAVRAAMDQADIELTCVGHGPMWESVRSNLRPGTTNVSFPGKVADHELECLYRASDVIVLPSRTRLEAFGIVLLEGMARGCVPVASDLPGVRDVVGDVGLLSPPGDPVALRRCLRFLAENAEEVCRRSQQSIDAAVQYTWSRTVDEYEELFDHIVRSEGRS
jgi:glycosyltransferase involved in cell wall biosynthesis